MILNPKLLIADEPVSALDASIQAQIINLLRDLRQQRELAILFISHDLNVIRYIADRVGIMYCGKLIEENVTSFGGKVESTDKIGRKKLAYDIQNFRDGFFFSAIISLPADKVAEFRRQLRLNDNILRTMFMEATEKASV